MGIKQLNQFLQSNLIKIYEDIHISEFKYKKVAIDISNFLFKYKMTYHNNWLYGILNLVILFRKYDVHCLFIYDTSSPPEKDLIKKERYEQRCILENKIKQLENAVQLYEEKNIISDILFNNLNIIKVKYNKQNILEDDNLIDLQLIKKEIERLKKQIIIIKPQDYLLTKQLFHYLNIPYINAPNGVEAEAICADLCKKKLVSAVLSADTDVLAYGAPIFICKISLDGKCTKINYKNLLKGLGFTNEQFLDFCIMTGTDFNKNIPRCGPKKVYKLITNYNSIENIDKLIDKNGNKEYDTTCLKYEKTREIFTNYQRINIKKIPFCGKPNFAKLFIFFKKNNIYINDINFFKNIFNASLQFV